MTSGASLTTAESRVDASAAGQRLMVHVLVLLLTAAFGWLASRLLLVEATDGVAAAALGVGLGLVFCFGARVIPAAALGVALAGLGLGATPLGAFGFAILAVPALWAGERVLKPTLEQGRLLVDEPSVWPFLLAAGVVMPLLAALAVGLGSLAHPDLADSANSLRGVFVIASVSGVLLSPWPVLLRRAPSLRPPRSGVLAMVGLLGMVAVIFFAPPDGLVVRLWFATLLPFVWLSYRHGLLGGLLASAVLTLGGALAVQSGLGPFAGFGVHVGMALVSAAGVFACVSTLVVVSLHRERSAAVARHAEASRQLTAAHRLARFGTWEQEIRSGRWWWSDESFRIAGMDPSEQEASLELYRSVLHPDDRKRALDAGRAAVLEGAPYDLQVRILDAAGRVRWVHLVGEVLDGEDAEPALFAGAVQDVTGRREEQERAVSSQKMDALGTLAAGIAHDFNNILLAIRTHSELLAQNLQGQPDSHDSIRQILSSTDRASRLVQQILTFGRGDAHSERGAIDLRDSVTASVDFLSATLPTTVKLRAHLGTRALLTRVDRTQLERVIVNLVTNAYQAGGDHVGIDLRAEVAEFEADEASIRGLPAGRYALLSVVDEGPGIAPEILERIFDPFFTTKPVGSGTGLGLSVVHGIIEAHGGVVRVASTVDEGTTFEIFLPLSEAGRAQAARVDIVPAAHGAERVLLVDDEIAVTRGTRRLLRRLGYQVEVRHDGASALALFLEDPSAFDVVVTDHSMPGLTGTELARAIRKVRPGLPVLLTTGFDARLRLEADEALFAAVLLKPFGGQELGAAIRAAVDEAADGVKNGPVADVAS